MQISKHTDYAFRVMLYLAVQQQKQPQLRVTIQHVADVYGISKSHLMKIVNKLVHAELLHATRGKNGGIRLNKSAAEIRLHSVYTVLNPQRSPVSCDSPACRIAGSCQLKQIFDGAYRQFLAHMEQFTLEDCLHDSSIELLKHTTVTPAAEQKGKVGNSQ